ncbi:MAG: hypothetical protein EOS77_27720 [Mesorhizobium sp.]|nr:MAG: hypothetical protein EOS77_27720 [Mesorhizobium sp.]
MQAAFGVGEDAYDIGAAPDQPSLPIHRRPESPTASAAVDDRQLVHMLANMVLAAETRGNHVY